MMSGHGTIDTAVKATQLGARDFLEKPIARDRLLVALRNALEHQAVVEELQELRGGGRPVRDGGHRARRCSGSTTLIQRDGAQRGPGADHRRERHRQGAGRARAPPDTRGARRARS